MQKYAHVFLTGIQSALVYRWNVAVRSVFSLVHLVFVVTLWGAAFAGRETIGGFSVEQTLTYFVVLLLLNFLIAAWNEDFQIAEEIRHGTINQFLLKPISHYAYRLALFAAARLVTVLVVAVPLLLVLPWMAPHLAFPGEPWRIAAAVPAILMAALLQFSVAYFFGLLAFWFLDIQGFVVLSLALETLLSGQMFPLDLAPPAVYAVLQHLPFYYLMYFPAAIVTGRIGLEETLYGLVVQAAWVVALLLLCRSVWRRGLAQHTAVGG